MRISDPGKVAACVVRFWVGINRQRWGHVGKCPAQRFADPRSLNRSYNKLFMIGFQKYEKGSAWSAGTKSMSFQRRSRR